MNESPPVFYRTSSPLGPLPKKLARADDRLEREDLMLESADLRLGRADLKPERADLRPYRPDIRPGRPDEGDKLIDKQTNKLKQVAQGQYVVSNTRCPALHHCELKWEQVAQASLWSAVPNSPLMSFSIVVLR